MQITDQHMVVLLGIRDRKTIREMAQHLGRSIGTIQQLEAELLDDVCIARWDPTKKHAAPFRLTRKGEQELTNHGYNVFPGIETFRV